MGVLENLYHGEVEKAYQTSSSARELFERLEESTYWLYDTENIKYDKKNGKI